MEGIVKEIPSADFELIFVDDGSRDETFSVIKALHNKDKRVKCISFSRNFGKEAAVMAGLRAAAGDCAVILDADMQHPPETIIEMYSQWENGYEVIEGVKESRGKENALHGLFANFFYSMISGAIGVDMRNSSDFKLLDKKVVNALASLKERNTFFRAMSFWSGFKRTTVYYKVQAREFGETKWSAKSLIKYAINNVVCFTYTPLSLALWLGAIFILIAGALGIKAFISKTNQNASAYLITAAILLSAGAIMAVLGIIGIYLGKIYDEIKGRPQYIISERL